MLRLPTNTFTSRTDIDTARIEKKLLILNTKPPTAIHFKIAHKIVVSYGTGDNYPWFFDLVARNTQLSTAITGLGPLDPVCLDHCMYMCTKGVQWLQNQGDLSIGTY